MQFLANWAASRKKLHKSPTDMKGTLNDACIFCKIIKGSIPSFKVYENDHVLAFLDINALSRGHTLVIPKTRYERIDEIPADVAAALGRSVAKVAQ